MTEITLTPSAELEVRLSRMVAAKNNANDLQSAALLALLIGLDHWEARPEQRGGVPKAEGETVLFRCGNCLHELQGLAADAPVMTCPECAKRKVSIIMHRPKLRCTG